MSEPIAWVTPGNYLFYRCDEDGPYFERQAYTGLPEGVHKVLPEAATPVVTQTELDEVRQGQRVLYGELAEQKAIAEWLLAEQAWWRRGLQRELHLALAELGLCFMPPANLNPDFSYLSECIRRAINEAADHGNMVNRVDWQSLPDHAPMFEEIRKVIDRADREIANAARKAVGGNRG